MKGVNKRRQLDIGLDAYRCALADQVVEGEELTCMHIGRWWKMVRGGWEMVGDGGRWWEMVGDEGWLRAKS